MTFTIGLTGSIGMGKSTTARMFADLGIPVWDADAAVARLYAPDGAAIPLLETVFGIRITRAVLRELVAADPANLPRIEAVVHPLVAADRAEFLADCRADIAVFDIPLLFETHLDDQFDLIVVVSAPPEVQRARVLARPGMTSSQFENLLVRQMPDDEKRARADVVIETTTLAAARQAVQNLLAEIREGKYA